MDLWIRSQDKTTLIRSYEIYISEQQNTYLIRAKRTSHILGVYNTFERALEVLDEIQNIFSLKIENKSYEESDLVLKAKMLNSVYEMPKE